jgi:hypothetical protein
MGDPLRLFTAAGARRSTDFKLRHEVINENDERRQGTTWDNSGHFMTSGTKRTRNGLHRDEVGDFPGAAVEDRFRQCASFCARSCWRVGKSETPRWSHWGRVGSSPGDVVVRLRRAARPDPLRLRSGQAFTAQRTFVQDDNQTAPLPTVSLRRQRRRGCAQ